MVRNTRSSERAEPMRLCGRPEKLGSPCAVKRETSHSPVDQSVTAIIGLRIRLSTRERGVCSKIESQSLVK